jgi:hypothetical protein
VKMKKKVISRRLPLQQHKFATHLARNSVIALVAACLALYIGMLGYHEFENMPWIDAFVNAAMILSGMGPMGELKTDGGKIFAGLYALFSGLMFILIIGIILAPVVNRYFVKLKDEIGDYFK